jgi:hypothetical protein
VLSHLELFEGAPDGYWVTTIPILVREQVDINVVLLAIARDG